MKCGTKVWSKGYLDVVFFFFFKFEKAKDLVIELAFLSFQQTGLTFFFFSDVKAILYNILLLLGASYKWGALGGGLNGH